MTDYVGTNCGSCGHPIEFAVKVPEEFACSNKPPCPRRPGGADCQHAKHLVTTPVNQDSAGDPKGKLAVRRDESGVLRFRYLKKDEEPGPGEKRGITHFATCEQSASWRSRSREPAR